MSIARNIAGKKCRGDEDAVSAAYVAVATALRSWNPEMAPWRPWCIRNVQTALNHYVRSKARQHRADKASDPPQLPKRPGTIRCEAGWRDDYEEVYLRDAIDRLPPMESVVISMWYISGEDATQIAKRLDVGERYVRRLRERGLKHLKELM